MNATAVQSVPPKSPPEQPPYPDRCAACKWCARTEVTGEDGERTAFLHVTSICCRVQRRPIDSIDVEGPCGSFEAHNFPYAHRDAHMAPHKIRMAQDRHFAATFRRPESIEALYRFAPGRGHSEPWWQHPAITETYHDVVRMVKNGLTGRKWR